MEHPLDCQTESILWDSEHSIGLSDGFRSDDLDPQDSPVRHHLVAINFRKARKQCDSCGFATISPTGKVIHTKTVH